MASISTSTRLLRTAIGDAAFSDAERRTTPTLPDTFDVFDVEFAVPRFRGLRPNWVFAVLNGTSAAARQRDTQQILADARTVAEQVTSSDFLVFVSDDPGVHLHEDFAVSRRPLFCLDAPDLPEPATDTPAVQHSPFVLAVRRRWNKVPGLTTLLSPYLKGTPVREGWQFFGRAAQLEQLVYSNENIVVVGARRIGKTSLLLEATRRMQERGDSVYYVNVQSYSKARDIVHELVRELSPKETVDAARRSKAFGENLLRHTLRTLAKTRRRTTLVIDEMGNALRHLEPEDWSVLGVLRSFAQQGHLRLIVSGFQESLRSFESNFAGPQVNFGDTLRLGLFTETEVQDFVLGPIRFWKQLSDQERRVILDSVLSTVGGHPFFLQHYCGRLFDAALNSDNLLEEAKRILRRDLFETLHAPVMDVWDNTPSATLRYVFLSCCKSADDEGDELRRATLNDSWVDEALRGTGFRSTVVGRARILSELSMRGLIVPDPRNPADHVIGAPAVYLVLKKSESNYGSLGPLLKKLRDDIDFECETWQLRSAAS